MENPEAYSFEAAPAECGIQQHDYMPVNKYQTYSTEAVSRMANVFTSDDNGKIKEVSFFTTTPGTTASFKIYLLTADGDDPEDGECVYESVPKTYDWGGYHKEALPDDAKVGVVKNQRYSVVVEETTPSGNYSISFGRSSDEEDYGSCKFHAVLNAGESYLYIDDKWNDLSDTEIQNVLNGGKTGTEMDNFPIKTYLSPVETNGAYLVLNGLDPYGENYEPIKIGSKIGYEAFFKGGTDDLPSSPVIIWSSSNPEILSIEIADSDNCKAVITGLKKGTYKVKVKVKAAGNNKYKSSGWKKVTFKIRVRF